MSVVIIDLLKIVHIHHKHGAGTVLIQFIKHGNLKLLSVPEPGQRIHMRRHLRLIQPVIVFRHINRPDEVSLILPHLV